MDTKSTILEPLLDRAEDYCKTSVEIIRLKTLDKTAALTSTLVSRSLFALFIGFFALLINIAIALWLGDLMGKVYYGFLVGAGCYALAGIILLIIHPFVKTRVHNAVIRELLN